MGWILLDLFLSGLSIFCFASLVAGAFGWWLRPHKRKQYGTWAVENAFIGGLAAFFVQHPRTVFVLAFLAAMAPYAYWFHRRHHTAQQELQTERNNL